MKKLILILLFISSSASAQKASIVKFDVLQRLIESKDKNIKVINFWATWCAPCVKELPLFEALNTSRPDGVEVTLINLDFADKIDKVNSFLVRKNMKATVLLLDEIDYNKWIDKVDKSWSGAMPATLIVNSSTGKRRFVERELVEGDLEKLISEVK